MRSDQYRIDHGRIEGVILTLVCIGFLQVPKGFVSDYQPPQCNASVDLQAKPNIGSLPLGKTEESEDGSADDLEDDREGSGISLSSVGLELTELATMSGSLSSIDRELAELGITSPVEPGPANPY
ncbi:hypothetical protein BDW62DRAFT_202650 [Aspergillus aurantiobrunneus]